MLSSVPLVLYRANAKSSNSLHLEEKEFAMEIIRRAYAEAAREGILANARMATKNLKKGNVKRGSLKDLYKDLEND